MTPKQHRLFDFIVKYKQDNGDSPTLRQMGSAMGVSIGTVQDHMKALIKLGKIQHKKGEPKYKVVA